MSDCWGPTWSTAPRALHRLRPGLYTDSDRVVHRAGAQGFTPCIGVRVCCQGDLQTIHAPRASHRPRSGLYTDSDRPICRGEAEPCAHCVLCARAVCGTMRNHARTVYAHCKPCAHCVRDSARLLVSDRLSCPSLSVSLSLSFPLSLSLSPSLPGSLHPRVSPSCTRGFIRP